MASDRLVCRECHRVNDPNENTCVACSSSSLTEDWAGYVVIAHPESSAIAREMQVDEAGAYALKVR
ncbi:DNA-directed RNA polymerase, subunit E'' [Halobacteria archaeon AArc-m2/3/4]|uniref:Transcription elongation factor Spt4 n=1 Tax=Natronoglomus mannanivorans TaxID=2979990 RepID=A0AAP3E4C4_9EURY|nr:transcription elongation factor subunit Spt4 [Halovivax sp. TS33]MCU4743824.1 DNA-directed RNA polymerase, subunit E'' [Halobacteria archaeon AArc-xg1-1]MCU4974325.1 DNA-directed RNA polymerase, subunit E'' [Halobacteria archaeon AArc-m2/3/4]